MTIRNTTATLLLSTAILVSGTAFAAAQQSGAGASFDSQLSEAAGALLTDNSGGIGREERLTAGTHLQIARDLNRQGRTEAAQQYLNLARGTLGLNTGASAPTVASVPFLSSSKDFYNPNI